MKRRFVTSICVGLLVWAAIDDALAARTLDVDDELAAAQDNDCLQYEPVKIAPRAAAMPLYSVPIAADIDLARSSAVTLSSVGGAYPLSGTLYWFMSLQR